LRVLYLWAGQEQSGLIPWKENGYEVISVGIDSNAELTFQKDILEVSELDLAEYLPFDFVWASPDCKVFSLANLHSGHWKKDIWTGAFIPQTEMAIGMIQRVKHTLDLIQYANPNLGWVLENPFGLLRHMPFMNKYHTATVTYCQYGDDRMKPTDLWGGFPRTFSPKRCNYGDRCHPYVPRSHKGGGTQGRDYEGRVRIPYDLAKDIYDSAQLSNGDTWLTLEDF